MTQKKRVFLSFRGEDRQQVNGLRLLAANPDFDLEFYDESVQTPYDSTNAAYIKQKISEKINRTSVTVCLIGKETYTSAWVNWELQTSVDKGNTLIAMALKGVDEAILPSLIRAKNLPFHPWDAARLHDLIVGN